MDHLLYWIWLSLRCGAGSELGSYLLKFFPTPKDIYDADETALRAVDGVDDSIAAALLDRDLSLPERILRYCERVNVGIMTCAGGIYPERLRKIHAKPLVLYYRGRVPDIDDNVCIACVGTRKCSEHGARAAYALGAELAEAGAVTVSGMALGIDACAQKGTLAAGGHTIAVLGCGIDRIYPAANRELMEQIAERGTLLTEFAPGTDPNGKNFPIRNRIISGLCQGTVVVEADYHSGSLITAELARKQGRDLFAYPGSAGEKLSQGTNDLIRSGATLVTCAADVLSEYELLYPHRIFTEKISGRAGRGVSGRFSREASENFVKRRTRSDENAVQKPAAPRKKDAPPRMERAASAPVKDLSGLGEMEREVMRCFSGAMSCEELSAELFRKCGISCDVGTLLGTLTVLEIGGYIEALPGGSYRLV